MNLDPNPPNYLKIQIYIKKRTHQKAHRKNMKIKWLLARAMEWKRYKRVFLEHHKIETGILSDQMKYACNDEKYIVKFVWSRNA